MNRAFALLAALLGITAGLALLPTPESTPVTPGSVSPSTDVSATSTIEWSFERYRAARLEMPVVSDEVTLLAVGDIMPGRGVARSAARHEKDWLFANVASSIRAADLAFANLEAPIAEGPEVPDDSKHLRADPGTEAILSKAGFDIVSVANNHAMDVGAAALAGTNELLAGKGIAAVGGGASETEARRAKIVEKNGIKIAFLAYADPAFTAASDRATASRPGIALLDPATVALDIAAASSADTVIVSMHAGDEYAMKENEAQRRFARAAIDAGADLVIGHHPHVIEPLELYKGKPILYSLGNFVFDQGWSDEARLGMAADIRLGKEGVRRIYWRPITVAASGQPAFSIGADFEIALARLGSAALHGVTIISESSYGTIERARTIELSGATKILTLTSGRLTIETEGRAEWTSPESWWVDAFEVADLDRDGRPDLAVSVWKSGDYGPSKPFWVADDDPDVRNHFFLYRFVDTGLEPVWQSSNLAAPNCSFAAVDIDNDWKQELIVTEGEYLERPTCHARYVAAWRWGGWGFENVWREELATH